MHRNNNYPITNINDVVLNNVFVRYQAHQKKIYRLWNWIFDCEMRSITEGERCIVECKLWNINVECGLDSVKCSVHFGMMDCGLVFGLHVRDHQV